MRLALLALLSCVCFSCTTDPCPSTCQGCCDLGVCRAGTANDQCGADGVECSTCGSARTCQAGLCRSTNTGGGAGGDAGATGGGGGATGGGGGGSGVDAGVRQMFVTSSRWPGSLVSLPAADAGADAGVLDALATADALCTAHALDAGLGGAWVAWLSTSQVTAASRLPAGRWTLVGAADQLVVDDAGVRLTTVLNRNERGVRVPASSVWTGIPISDDNFGFTCLEWTAGDGGFTATVGVTDGGRWHADHIEPCETLSRLYCFER